MYCSVSGLTSLGRLYFVPTIPPFQWLVFSVLTILSDGKCLHPTSLIQCVSDEVRLGQMRVVRLDSDNSIYTAEN